MGGLLGGNFLSGGMGIATMLRNNQQNDALSSSMQDIEGAKVRENMVRQTVKKLTELEQEMRMDEFKMNVKLGESWSKSLGGGG